MDMAMDTESAVRAGQRARDLFLGKRANCAEAVFLAVCEELSSPLGMEAAALLTPLGGGVGIRGENCGAMLAGIIAMGLVHGRKDSSEGELQEHRGGLWRKYKVLNQLPDRFVKRFGSLQCWELTESLVYGSRRCRENCERIVGETATMAMELLREADQGCEFDFGKNLLQQAQAVTGLGLDELLELKSRGEPFPLPGEQEKNL